MKEREACACCWLSLHCKLAVCVKEREICVHEGEKEVHVFSEREVCVHCLCV